MGGWTDRRTKDGQAVLETNDPRSAHMDGKTGFSLQFTDFILGTVLINSSLPTHRYFLKRIPPVKKIQNTKNPTWLILKSTILNFIS